MSKTYTFSRWTFRIYKTDKPITSHQCLGEHYTIIFKQDKPTIPHQYRTLSCESLLSSRKLAPQRSLDLNFIATNITFLLITLMGISFIYQTLRLNPS